MFYFTNTQDGSSIIYQYYYIEHLYLGLNSILKLCMLVLNGVCHFLYRKKKKSYINIGIRD